MKAVETNAKNEAARMAAWLSDCLAGQRTCACLDNKMWKKEKKKQDIKSKKCLRMSEQTGSSTQRTKRAKDTARRSDAVWP